MKLANCELTTFSGFDQYRIFDRNPELYCELTTFSGFDQ